MLTPFVKNFLILFLLGIFLFQANFVFASEIKYPPLPGILTPQEIDKKIQLGEIEKEDRLGLYFKYFFNLSFIIIILVCLGVLIYGGVLYLLSPAKPAVLISAKKNITSALLGLLILFSSYLILVTINPQLSILPSWKLKEKALSPTPVSEKKEVITYFQVPSGVLIEKMLSQIEQATTSVKTGKKITKIEAAVEDVEEASENLKKELAQLNYLTTEKCNCGISNCTADTEIGLDRTRCKCIPNAAEPCRIDCDIDELKAQIKKVEEAIAELNVARMGLVNVQMPLINNYLELRKAGMLMSLDLNQQDYSLFAHQKREIEEEGTQEIKITSFSGWPKTLQGIRLSTENLVDEIINKANQAKTATTTNKEISNTIVATAPNISESANLISENLIQVSRAIDTAKKEKSARAIEIALSKIEDFLSTSSEELFIAESALNGIDSLADSIQSANLLKIEIKENCQKIRELINKTRAELSQIETLSNEIKFSLTIEEKLLKFSLIELKILRIGEYLLEIAGEEYIFLDPASFYFKYSTTEAVQARKETERLNPLIIFSNISPAEFNAQITQVIKEALGTEIFQFTEEEWDSLVNEALAEGVSESFTEFLEKLGKAISEKMRRRLVDNIMEKTETSPTASLFFKIVLAQDTRYGEKVLKEKLKEQLNEKLKTELDPWLENVLIAASSDIIAKIIAKNAPELLDPETYNKIHQVLAEFLYTQLRDIPFLAEKLEARLVDYMPDFMADKMTQINDIITQTTEEFKSVITQQLTEFVANFIEKFGKTLGIGNEFLEALVEATTIILEDITGEYIDMLVLERTPIYEIQYELGIWLETTVFDILPKDWQDALEKEIIDLLPPEAAQFFKNIDDVIVAIRDALTPKAGGLAAKAKAAGEKNIIDALFPTLRETLEKTIYELLVENEPFKSFFESKFKDKLPDEITKSLYNFLPDKAKTPIIEQLLPEYADTLKNKRLIDLVEPESKRNLLTKKIKDLTPEELDALEKMGDETLLEMMSAAGAVLTTGLVAMMVPEFRDFYNKTVLETLPKEFRETIFQLTRVDDPDTSENEARAKRVVDYTTPSTIAVVDLTQQYLPDPDDRPPTVNQLLAIANKTPYRLIADEVLGLNQPQTAEKLDTPLPNFLEDGSTAKKILNLTWLEVVAGAGYFLTKSLLERLAETDPALHRALTTKLKDLISREDLLAPENQNKTVLELIAEKVGDPSVADKIQNKKIIELFPFLSKSIIDLVKEKTDSDANIVFSQSFYDFLPQEIKTILEAKLGDLIKDKYPFNLKLIEILPPEWQKTLNEFFGLTEEDFVDAVVGTIEEMDIVREINETFSSLRSRVAQTITEALLEKIAEKAGVKIDSPEIAGKIDRGIKKALKPLLEKSIGEKLKKGYLLNSLKEL